MRCFVGRVLCGAVLAGVLLVVRPLGALAQDVVAAPSLSAPSAQAYRVLGQAIEENLRVHVLGKWFPAAVDARGRGFVQNFDEAWRPTDDGVRSLVYQSRQTWTSAHAAMRYPERAEAFTGYSKHGLAFLRDTLWDREHGGLFWAVGPDDAPSTPIGNEKHVYGIAFAIYAASANYRATSDPDALDLAQRAFRWLDEHAHDAANGGYHEALTRDGKPILAASPAGRVRDAIGTRYGLKSMNSHIHLLEAFTALHEVWPDPAVRARLEEVFVVVRDKIVVSEIGCQNLFFTTRWQPIPGEDSYGHDVETAFLLIEAAHVLGRGEDVETWAVARGLVDHALEVGWDAEHGGFFGDGPAFGPATRREKVWWVQAEGLNALVLMHGRFGGETTRYWEALNQQWAFIRDRQVDPMHGGWFPRVHEDGTPEPGRAKSDAWTEAYHQGRALLTSSAALKALADGLGG